MNTTGKTLKYVDEQGVEREFCATVCDEHVLVGDGTKTLREELTDIRRRLSSSPSSAIYHLRQTDTPFHWEKGLSVEDDLMVKLSTQDAKISDVKLKVSPLTQAYESINLFFGEDFFEQDLDGNGVPDGWTSHTYGVIHEKKPNRGTVSLTNGKLLIDASQATDMTNEIGVSIPIGHLLKRGHQYVAVIKVGATQPASTITRLQYYGMAESGECVSTGGTDLTPRRETVFYFDPFSKWFDHYPSQPIEMESFKMDIFIKGAGRVLIEKVALYELPYDFYGIPDFGLFNCDSETVSWKTPLEMPSGVRFISVSPIKEQFETRVLFAEPIKQDAAIPDVINLSEKLLYRYVDEEGQVMAQPMTYPIQVEGHEIEKHWGLCTVSDLNYAEELHCTAQLIRYELRSLQEDDPWFEVDEETFYDTRYYQKRVLYSNNVNLNFTLDYDYEAASQAQRIESTYLSMIQQQIMVNEAQKAVEEIAKEVERLDETIKKAGLDAINEVKQDLKEVEEWVDEAKAQLDQPINDSDVDDILGIIKGVN